VISYGDLVNTPPSIANSWPVPDDGSSITGAFRISRMRIMVQD